MGRCGHRPLRSICSVFAEGNLPSRQAFDHTLDLQEGQHGQDLSGEHACPGDNIIHQPLTGPDGGDDGLFIIRQAGQDII